MSIALRIFRVAAVAEALSWAGLLAGMFVKWILQTSDRGVEIFGPIHGGVFVLYGLSVLYAARVERWSLRTLLLGLVSAVPPFMSIWFERRVLADRADSTPASV